MRLPLGILVVSSLVFWVSIWEVVLGFNIVLDTVRKFACYLSSIVWINSAFYLREVAAETEVDSWEFQKEQVKLTLVFLAVIILSECIVGYGRIVRRIDDYTIIIMIDCIVGN